MQASGLLPSLRRCRQDSNLWERLHMTQKTKPPAGDAKGQQGGKTSQPAPAKQGGGQQEQERNQGPAKNPGQGKK